MKSKSFLVTKGAFRGVLLAYILILFVVIWGAVLQVRQDDTIHQNQRAIDYICSTTTVLDRLVNQQAKQIKTNFSNGTYDRLLKNGLITKNNIAQARKTLRNFEASHRKLVEKSACSEDRRQG